MIVLPGTNRFYTIFVHLNGKGGKIFLQENRPIFIQMIQVAQVDRQPPGLLRLVVGKRHNAILNWIVTPAFAAL